MLVRLSIEHPIHSVGVSYKWMLQSAEQIIDVVRHKARWSLYEVDALKSELQSERESPFSTRRTLSAGSDTPLAGVLQPDPYGTEQEVAANDKHPL